MRRGESGGPSGLELEVLIVAFAVLRSCLNPSNLFSDHCSLSSSFGSFSIPLKVFDTLDMFASVKVSNFLCFTAASCWAFYCFSCCAIDTARCLAWRILTVSNSSAKASTDLLSASICSRRTDSVFSLDVVHLSILYIWATLTAATMCHAGEKWGAAGSYYRTPQWPE